MEVILHFVLGNRVHRSHDRRGVCLSEYNCLCVFNPSFLGNTLCQDFYLINILMLLFSEAELAGLGFY